MILPNFIIIGAAKSGTTALYHYLKQHPQIYLSPIKETEFFAFEGDGLNFKGPGDLPRATITNFVDYQAQFQGVVNEVAIGEASPVYIYSSKAPERIKNYLPDVKLIAILREPVERAYSQYLMFIRDQREPLQDFAQAIEEEKNRKEQGWAWGWRYLELGFYYTQLKRYFDIFNSEQIRVYLYDDLKNNPKRVIEDICTFLNVDNTFTPDMSFKPNISGVPQNKLLHGFLRNPNVFKDLLKPFLSAKLRKRLRLNLQNSNLSKPELKSEVKEQLLPIFREDILQLQDLIQRDLSPWLN